MYSNKSKQQNKFPNFHLFNTKRVASLYHRKYVCGWVLSNMSSTQMWEVFVNMTRGACTNVDIFISIYWGPLCVFFGPVFYARKWTVRLLRPACRQCKVVAPLIIGTVLFLFLCCTSRNILWILMKQQQPVVRHMN